MDDFEKSHSQLLSNSEKPALSERGESEKVEGKGDKLKRERIEEWKGGGGWGWWWREPRLQAPPNAGRWPKLVHTNCICTCLNLELGMASRV